jgi:glutathione S-transferase
VSTTSVRVHRIPFSTNVERVALACAHKGVPVDWVDHDPADRGALRALSGQELVPVAETTDGVLTDSPVILEWLEQAHPAPPLLPADPARRAEVRIFSDWFNLVWKRAPNALVDDPPPPAAHARTLRHTIRAHLDRFEALLTGHTHLLGDELTLADITAFPFLKYPVLGLAPDDIEPFHAVLVDTMPTADRPHLTTWVHRMDQLPRA